MKIGDRVKVSIPTERRGEYAVGAYDALNGLAGTVERIGTTGALHMVLVAFDQPAPIWWPHQTPATSWWFDPSELTVVQ